jgi:hypothetical protein
MNSQGRIVTNEGMGYDGRLMLSSSEDPAMTDRCQTPIIDQRIEDRETLEGMIDGMSLKGGQ